jgi:hypothetical protein
LLALGFAATTAVAEGRWQQVENRTNCEVWNDYPQPKSTATWTGDCVEGKADGYGELIWRYLADGEWTQDNYTGTLRYGKEHGRGVYVLGSGSEWPGKYEGDWKDGEPHGRGVSAWVDGDRYEGDWEGSLPHGRGAILFANGDKCEGDWREGKLLGTGKGWVNGQLMKCVLDGGNIKFGE